MQKFPIQYSIYDWTQTLLKVPYIRTYIDTYTQGIAIDYMYVHTESHIPGKVKILHWTTAVYNDDNIFWSWGCRDKPWSESGIIIFSKSNHITLPWPARKNTQKTSGASKILVTMVTEEGVLKSSNYLMWNFCFCEKF